ncbi:hypothetical protein BJX99DRAFT_242954 [Aspergillus californicus]
MVSSMIVADLFIANAPVPNHIGTARSGPSPVIVPTPRPRARHAPFTPQPTVGSMTAPPTPPAILFQWLASRTFETPWRSPVGAAGRFNLTWLSPLCFSPSICRG